MLHGWGQVERGATGACSRAYSCHQLGRMKCAKREPGGLVVQKRGLNCQRRRVSSLMTSSVDAFCFRILLSGSRGVEWLSGILPVREGWGQSRGPVVISGHITAG